jgi:hypothetical protein
MHSSPPCVLGFTRFENQQTYNTFIRSGTSASEQVKLRQDKKMQVAISNQQDQLSNISTAQRSRLIRALCIAWSQDCRHANTHDSGPSGLRQCNKQFITPSMDDFISLEASLKQRVCIAILLGRSIKLNVRFW